MSAYTFNLVARLDSMYIGYRNSDSCAQPYTLICILQTPEKEAHAIIIF